MHRETAFTNSSSVGISLAIVVTNSTVLVLLVFVAARRLFEAARAELEANCAA
jgi:hypothetical protein